MKVRYLVEKRSGGKTLFYWQPKRTYMVEGKPVSCPIAPRRIAPSNLITDAVAEAQQLNQQLDRWLTGHDESKVAYLAGTFGWLVGKYKTDTRYTELAPSTQKLYGWMLPSLLEVFGDIPLRSITRVSARAFYDTFSQKKRMAHQLISTARLIMNFGIDIGQLEFNPFENMRISKGSKRSQVWSAEQITNAISEAEKLGWPSVGLAIRLAMDIGQRPGDVRSMTWGSYDGTMLKLRQSKTGEWVEVPVLPDLKKCLDMHRRGDDKHLLVNESTGQPYRKELLQERVRTAMRNAGISDDLQLRDLRRTAVVRMAVAGSTNAEIAAITGHSINNTAQILEVYLPRNSAMAKNAMDKVGKLQKLEKKKAESEKRLEKPALKRS